MHNACVDCIDSYANPVGLTLADSAADAANCTLWESDYAVVALVVIDEPIASKLKSSHGEGLAILSQKLDEKRRKHKIVDGYLILAIAHDMNTYRSPALDEENKAMDNDDLHGTIQNLENDLYLCRKQIIWPVGDPDDPAAWEERIRRIPILSLPYAKSAAANADSTLISLCDDDEILMRQLANASEDEIISLIESYIGDLDDVSTIL